MENTSFESPAVSGSWQQFAAGTPGLGWNVTGGPLEIHRGILGGPSDGLQHAELDGKNSVTISQVLSTAAGHTLSFDYKARPDTPLSSNDVRVMWNNVDVTPDITFDSSSWQTATIQITGTGSSDTILSFEDIGTSDCLGTFLDNVPVMIAR